MWQTVIHIQIPLNSSNVTDATQKTNDSKPIGNIERQNDINLHQNMTAGGLAVLPVTDHGHILYKVCSFSAVDGPVQLMDECICCF